MSDRRRGQPRFRRVRATGSRRPGYIRGTSTAEEEMLRTLREAHRRFVRDLTARLRRAPKGSIQQILSEINTTGQTWQERIVEMSGRDIQSLYSSGLEQGGVETGLGFDPRAADPDAVRMLATKPDGVVPALQDFVEDERKYAERVVRESFEEDTLFDLDEVRGKLEERLTGEKWKLERIVLTESSKIAGMGRLHAWENDPRRDWYDYHYIATRDERTRPQHMRFMREGPYTFEQVKEIWLDEREPYNCRCTLARTRKPKSVLVDQGYVTREEAERLL